MGSFTRHDLYEEELRKIIHEEIERLKDEVSSGLLKSLDDYRSVTGKIAGLRQSLDYMEEASSNVSKRIGV